MANKTVLQIYGMANDLLRQEGNSTGIPGLEETRTIDWINDLHKQFFDEFLTNQRNYPAYMKKEKGYTLSSGTELAASVAAGATSFTVDSSSALGTSGAGVIYKSGQYDIFTHSGNSGGTVSGVTGIDFAHSADEAVYKLEALPSDFGRLRIEMDREKRGEGIRINGGGYDQVPDMPEGEQFALWQNPSDSSWYIWPPRGQTGDLLAIYDKKPTELTATSSNIDIPESLPDHWYIVWGLVAIFRQVLDEDYVPQKERNEQLRYLNAAMSRGTSGRRIQANNHFFRRFGK